MATFYLPSSDGGYSSGTYVRYRIVVTEGALSGRTREVTVSVEYWRTNTGYSSYGDGTCYCTINGARYSQTVTPSQKVTYNSYTKLFSKTVDVTYDNSGNASVSVWAYSDTNVANLNSSSNGGTITLTPISPVTYTVTYNANGGTSGPITQTKTYNQSLTLTTSIPSRTGYTFSHWLCNTTVWNPGDVIPASVNYSFTLVAQWTLNKYQVTYNANGGSNAPSAQYKKHDINLTLSANQPTRNDYDFVGWGTSTSDSTAYYSPGGTYSQNAPITLYAIWKKSYTPPWTTSVVGPYRCDANGDPTEDGMYFYAEFDWEWFEDTPVTGCSIEWYCTTDADDRGSATPVVTPAGDYEAWTDGVFGGGELRTDKTYIVQLRLTDAHGDTVFPYTVPSKLFPIDFIGDPTTGHTGAAFGKPADTPDLLDIAWDTKITGNLTVDGSVNVVGFADAVYKTLLDRFYPINSIYISYSHTNPGTLFGGEWQRLANRFLWGCDEQGTIGSTGGSEKVTLNIDQMPVHSHPVMFEGYGSAAAGVLTFKQSSSAGYFGYNNQAKYAATTGGGQAHDNMPPYIQVSIWRRIA